ncbi:MAG: S8 family serine peptidase [Aggregatilineales bacterium]
MRRFFRNRRGILSVCVLAISLAASVVFPATLVRVAAQSKAINCAVTDTQLIGQANGGLAGVLGQTTSQHIIPPPDPNAGQSAVDLAVDPKWMADLAQAIGVGDQKVAVLVIDDFHQHTDALKTHGELVYEVFQQLFQQAGLNADPKSGLIQVNIADANGYQSDLIAGAIRQQIYTLYQSGFRRFVLNMSFVEVPCHSDQILNKDGRSFDFQEFLAANAKDPVNNSLRAFLGANNEANVAKLAHAPDGQNTGPVQLSSVPLTNYLSSPVSSPSAGNPSPDRSTPRPGNGNGNPNGLDDLRQLIVRLTAADTPNGFMAVAVGSAGNFGSGGTHPPALYPAGWPEVLSASASLGPGFSALWDGSNVGEISAPGAWYLFGDGEYRSGTSFAAPGISTALALCLTHTPLSWSPLPPLPPTTPNASYKDVFLKACGRS